MEKYIVFILVTLLTPVDVQASYFNTDRPQKIIGSFLTEVEHIDEIAKFSNSFGFLPKNVSEITRYLDANVYKMLPMISIGNLLFDPETGMYRNDPSGIIDAIEMSAVRHREIYFYSMNRCGRYERRVTKENPRHAMISKIAMQRLCLHSDRWGGFSDSNFRGPVWCILRLGLS